MDKYKAISLVLLGVVIGLGYSVACGSNDEGNATMPALPGVGPAMAQSGCAQWEVMTIVFDDSFDGFTSPVPEGWTPFSHHNWDHGIWLTRCVQ